MTTEQIEKVLAEHERYLWDKHHYKCECGRNFKFSWTHRAHVAAQIKAALDKEQNNASS